MLHGKQRITLPAALDTWIDGALMYPGVRLVEVTREILVNSVRLPGAIHGDPVDRLLVATARRMSCPLVTADRELLNYKYVEAIPPSALKILN